MEGKIKINHLPLEISLFFVYNHLSNYAGLAQLLERFLAMEEARS